MAQPFDRVPSAKILARDLRIDNETAKKLHAVLKGDDETIDDVLGPSNVLTYQSGRASTRGLAMQAADKLLETHGVEEARREPWGDSSKHDFEYLNAGDTYNTTLLFRGRRVWIGTWGDEVEGLGATRYSVRKSQEPWAPQHRDIRESAQDREHPRSRAKPLNGDPMPRRQKSTHDPEQSARNFERDTKDAARLYERAVDLASAGKVVDALEQLLLVNWWLGTAAAELDYAGDVDEQIYDLFNTMRKNQPKWAESFLRMIGVITENPGRRRRN